MGLQKCKKNYAGYNFLVNYMIIKHFNYSELEDFFKSSKEWDIIIISHEDITSTLITSKKINKYLRGLDGKNDKNEQFHNIDVIYEYPIIELSNFKNTVSPCTHGLLSKCVPTHIFYACVKEIEYGSGLIFVNTKDLIDSIKSDFSSNEIEYYLKNDYINVIQNKQDTVKYKIFDIKDNGDIVCSFNSNHNFPVFINPLINKFFDYCKEYVRYSRNYTVYNCKTGDFVLIKNRKILTGIQGWNDKTISETIFINGFLK